MNAPAFPEEGGGRLGLNVLHFCRALRAAGMPVGTGRALGAVRAVRRCGIDDRETFYWALHAALVSRPDQREIFGQMFHVFWRNPHLLERMMQLVLPRFRTGGTGTGTGRRAGGSSTPCLPGKASRRTSLATRSSLMRRLRGPRPRSCAAWTSRR